LVIFFLCSLEEMASTGVCQSFPGNQTTAPPPVRVFVKRWELVWSPATPGACNDGAACCSWSRVAKCTWKEGAVRLPAVRDWPRWRVSDGLPADEYWLLSWAQQSTCPVSNPDPIADPNNCFNCGLTVTWLPVWSRIPTPRDFRMVPCPATPADEVEACADEEWHA
jgi:hypothetical protein